MSDYSKENLSDSSVGMRTPKLGSMIESAASSAFVAYDISKANASQNIAEHSGSKAKKRKCNNSNDRIDALEAKLDRFMNIMMDKNDPQTIDKNKSSKSDISGGVVSPEVARCSRRKYTRSIFSNSESEEDCVPMLTGKDGVFGAELEKSLKDKKEQRKAVQDLLPERLGKRKMPFSNSVPSKKPSYAQRDNFRPSRYVNKDRDYNRFNASNTTYTRKYDNGTRARKPSFTAGSGGAKSSKQ